MVFKVSTIPCDLVFAAHYVTLVGHQWVGEWVCERNSWKIPWCCCSWNKFLMTLHCVIKLFRNTGSIKRKSGSRTLREITPETSENVRQVMDDNPHTSLKRPSYLTCHIHFVRKLLKRTWYRFPIKWSRFNNLNHLIMKSEWFIVASLINQWTLFSM